MPHSPGVVCFLVLMDDFTGRMYPIKPQSVSGSANLRVHLSPVSDLLGGWYRHSGLSIVIIGIGRPIRMPDLEGGWLLSISDRFIRHRRFNPFSADHQMYRPI